MGGVVNAAPAAAWKGLVARAVTMGLVRVAARAGDGQGCGAGGRVSVAAPPDEQEQEVVGEHESDVLQLLGAAATRPCGPPGALARQRTVLPHQHHLLRVVHPLSQACMRDGMQACNVVQLYLCRGMMHADLAKCNRNRRGNANRATGEYPVSSKRFVCSLTSRDLVRLSGSEWDRVRIELGLSQDFSKFDSK